MSATTNMDHKSEVLEASEAQTGGVVAANNTDQLQPTEEEHPDARKIRGQVEFYFSDKNLRTDLHLLQCCSGRDNLPVSISRICGWRKMRQWKKKDVVSALRRSAVLQVTPDGKKVSRTIPLVGKCLLDEDYSKEVDDAEISYDPRTKRAIQHPVARLPQEKKEYPPGMTKNMMKPTGFEDTYVEGPITPQVAEEEMAMYDPDKPFVERIEIAIQRFKQKRRMHEMYSKIFNKFMKFGGVDCEPRMFGGLSQQEMKEMTAEEIARATATHQVQWDREDSEKWVVDFLGVGEAFLSSYFPTHYGHNPNQVKTACQVLRSFYNYLLFHQVCQEHRDQLLLARAVCDKAEAELPKTYIAGNALPGSFNVAASTIVGGSHAGSYTGSSGWADELEPEEKKNTAGIGMKNEEAFAMFETAVMVYGTEQQYNALLSKASPNPSSLQIINTEAVGLEIIAIKYANNEDETSIQALKDANRLAQTTVVDMQPLGKLICKYWFLPDFKHYDLPKHKHPPHTRLPSSPSTYEFWIEDSVLRECFVGMKLDATVLTLEGGIQILDEVKETFCSFFKCLPNELWEARKQPRFRLLKKELDVLGLEDENGMSDGFEV